MGRSRGALLSPEGSDRQSLRSPRRQWRCAFGEKDSTWRQAGAKATFLVN